MLTLGARLHSTRWLLLAMLVLLHCTLLFGVESPWARPLLLAHMGLFLIWQPLWRGERELSPVALALIALAALAMTYWLNWWVVAFWLIGLFGLVGARVFSFRDRWTRQLYLAVVAYLLAVLLLWVVPHLFAAQATIGVGRVIMSYMLPLWLVAMALLPGSKEQPDEARAVDFIYSLLLFMLLALVVLGSLAFMTLAQLDYPDALLRTLFLIGLLLLALGGLWNPRFSPSLMRRTGFGGLRAMFSRYLLSVGTPFENWLRQLAEAAQREPDAPSYLRRAIALLGDLPWLSGLSWQTSDDAGQIGEVTQHEVQVQEGGLRLTLYARHAHSPSILLHVYLLAQMIGYFYQAKQREQNLRDITRLQAVYETGSRLTHDLKNMLQSLHSLTAIAQSQEERSKQLLQQQLPQLTRRIEQTLSKLHQPQQDDAAELALHVWWDGLRLRNQHQSVAWRSPDVLPEIGIPAALFDCVLDNLLDNALKKRQAERDIAIAVELHSAPLCLRVCDSGSPIAAQLSTNLLRNVVVSDNGLGIGLYQAARWAEQLGYRLTLSSNQPGAVCFELTEHKP
ncbi:MAG TPA: ATP-binding protein [Gallionella sp.]|nr:ATP-binding protein [Gallionella sp.]